MTDEAELTYYRAVEDLFAQLRGVPHVLSARDFQLLRSWWRDEVPVEAVAVGLREAMARRAERGESPVVSLAYCQHAVRRHARRLAEMRTGAGEAAGDLPALDSLLVQLDRAADAHRDARPAVTRALEAVRRQVEDLLQLPPAAIEAALWDLETALLDACRRALEEPEREEIARAAAAAAPLATAAGGMDDSARERVVRAHSDRLLRHLLGLPRLELP